MKHVAIIGAGNIGRRYLQSFSLTAEPYKIYMVDCSAEALCLSKKMADELQMHQAVFYLNDIKELPEKIDLAAVTTTSGVRKEIIFSLIRCTSVKYLILEKYLFDRLEDYEQVKCLFAEKEIKAWVNCTRRAQSSFINLKRELQESDYWEISVSGGDWGLGCNAVHYLDLIAYLSGTENWNLSIEGLEPQVFESKRKPYKEIAGTISGRMGKCRSFQISSYSNSSRPFIFSISTNRSYYVIDEGGQHICCISEDGSKNEQDFPLLYTSQIMEKIIKDIIETGICLLTSYEESARIHMMLQRPLTKFFEDHGFDTGSCPIT